MNSLLNITYTVRVAETKEWQRRIIHWDSISEVAENSRKNEEAYKDFGALIFFKSGQSNYVKETVDEIWMQLSSQQYTLGGKR